VASSAGDHNGSYATTERFRAGQTTREEVLQAFQAAPVADPASPR
jgi:hypothetical protein